MFVEAAQDLFRSLEVCSRRVTKLTQRLNKYVLGVRNCVHRLSQADESSISSGYCCRVSGGELWAVWLDRHLFTAASVSHRLRIHPPDPWRGREPPRRAEIAACRTTRHDGARRWSSHISDGCSEKSGGLPSQFCCHIAGSHTEGWLLQSLVAPRRGDSTR
ncbi:MAG: hypothetical protein ACI9C1_002056 [Candidatus Aldehydirespiratoraceae bacterium]